MSDDLTAYLRFFDEHSIADVCGITQEELEAMYLKGYLEYQAGQHKQAAQSFAYCIYLKPDDARATQAFATTMQALKDYEKALFYYARLIVLDAGTPAIGFNIIDCCLALKQRAQAKEALSALMQEISPDDALYEKALGYKAILGMTD
jgi:tetratricopeptide (TPR) repeat protein